MSEFHPTVETTATRVDAGVSSPFYAEVERSPLGLSRRGLLLGGGLSAAVGLLCPAECQAQFDVKPVELPFADQKKAVDVLSFFVRWLSLYELASAYQRRHGALKGEDKEPMALLARYLTETLKAREADVQWIAGIAAGERAQALLAAAMQAIEQSPLRDAEKGEALRSFDMNPLKERLSKASDEAKSVVDGVATSLKETTARTGVPQVAEAELWQRWLCAVLHSMLASAVASGQWYAVTTITMKMKSSACL